MKKAFVLALLLAAELGRASSPALESALDLATSQTSGTCRPGVNCSVWSVTATAPQGLASSACLVSGGTGTSGVCLGGYPSVGAALYLGVTPSARTTGNRTLLSNGTSTWLNAPGSTIFFDVNGSSQWNITATSLSPQSTNVEDIGAAATGVDDLFVRKINAQTGERLTLTGGADATTTTSAASVTVNTPNALSANKLAFDVQNNGTSVLKADAEGDTTIAGTLTATNILRVASSQYTAVGNVGGGTDNLMGYTVPANTLNADGDVIRITGAGTIANNANAKQLSFTFPGSGGCTWSLASLPASVAGAWFFEGTIQRTASNAQRCTYELRVINTGTNALSAIYQLQGTQTATDSSTITWQTAAVGVADNDVVQNTMLVEAL